ncbi:hypothetical protein D3C80_559030 [compost metagenome]
MDIDKPTLTNDHPDRVIACQEAMELSVAELIDKATAAGWKYEEVIAAISELADNLMLARHANADTESSIEELQRLNRPDK